MLILESSVFGELKSIDGGDATLMMRKRVTGVSDTSFVDQRT